MSHSDGTAKGSNEGYTSPASLAWLVDFCRERGVDRLEVQDGSYRVAIVMGNAPAAPLPVRSPEESEKAERRAKLRRILGREPTENEMQVLP